jgi:hypothetical protein
MMQTDLDWSHDQYVRITVSGTINKTDLVGLMAEILQHPDYTKKHTFWDLRHVTMGLSIADLREIIGVLKLYRPQTRDFADRAALLVPGKMNQAMAQVFVTMTRMLPIRYQVFSDWETAQQFLIN